MSLYIGAPIWTSRKWVGYFFPKGTQSSDFLREYSRRLTTVEGNTTFYAVPGPNTVAAWAAETPEGFRFCFKVPRSISHSGKLIEHIEEAHSFIEVMGPLVERLGPMFLQLPPRYHPNLYNDLKTFLDAWPKDMQLAVEVRHLRWFEPPFYDRLNDLLAAHQMARVVIDTRPIRSMEGEPILEGSVYENLLRARERKPDLPILPAHTASFTFLRYIGHPQAEVNAPYLDEWSRYLAARPPEENEAYIFCHCPDEKQDPAICRQFYQRLQQEMDLPPLPWETVETPPPEQPRLF